MRIPAITLVALICILLFCNPQDLLASKAIALTMRVSGDVQIKKEGEQNSQKLVFGTALDDGDWIKTGSDGLCILVFTDDKSQVKIQANTEVVIEGKRDAESNIAKRLSMEIGEIFTKVEAQRGSFQVATPTSVASVKGTEFWVIVLEDGTTEVVTLEGLVELMNRYSGQIVEIRRGQQGRSDPDGNIQQNDVNLDDWGDPDDDDEYEDEQEPRSIRIELEDRDGREKVIEIEFTD